MWSGTWVHVAYYSGPLHEIQLRVFWAPSATAFMYLTAPVTNCTPCSAVPVPMPVTLFFSFLFSLTLSLTFFFSFFVVLFLYSPILTEPCRLCFSSNYQLSVGQSISSLLFNAGLHFYPGVQVLPLNSPWSMWQTCCSAWMYMTSSLFFCILKITLWKTK